MAQTAEGGSHGSGTHGAPGKAAALDAGRSAEKTYPDRRPAGSLPRPVGGGLAGSLRLAREEKSAQGGLGGSKIRAQAGRT